MGHYLKEEMLAEFEKRLIEDERSSATIQKYLRDVRGFFSYANNGKSISKETVVNYKRTLMERYAPASANSMLAALNRFLKEMGWFDCIVKSIRIQNATFRPKERELSKQEYFRLVESANRKKNGRLSLIMQTIAATGIRISELKFITVESLKDGCAVVSMKGKTRKILIPQKLCAKLRNYAKEKGIAEGSVFITKNGNSVDRTNILHEMKSLCREANVDRKKVFPHNLRHLFACLYYQSVKDLSRLADLLGHSSVNTTRIYTSVSGREQMRQIERLGLILTQ